MPQIGTRRPLIIRKNNFVSSAENQNPSNTDTRALMTQPREGIPVKLIKQESQERLLNRTLKVSNLNLQSNQKYGSVESSSHAISQSKLAQLLEPSLNSTMRSREDPLDSAIVKNINKTKKKLDSARRSRIQQIKESAVNTNSSNEDLLQLE